MDKKGRKIKFYFCCSSLKFLKLGENYRYTLTMDRSIKIENHQNILTQINESLHPLVYTSYNLRHQPKHYAIDISVYHKIINYKSQVSGTLLL